MKPFALILLCISSYYCQAQIIFTYGTKQVGKPEFLKAYHRNGGTTASADDYREYLDLYIKYKLKVQAAYDMKLDTAASQKKELLEYRLQLADSYTGVDSISDKLIQEEFARSQKDIQVGMIYIPVSSASIADSVASAKRTIQEAYDELTRGADFQHVAARYSRDPNVSVNKGNIGYITAFVLPYAIETELYGTPKGGFTKPFKTKSGWLILKNLDERPAAGRVQVSQILIGYPSDDGETAKLHAKKLADSLYSILKNGTDFKKLAEKFSHDLFSYQEGGLLPAFGSGTYDVSFEREAFALQNAGDISKPFQTINGFHILRLEKKFPVPKTMDSAGYDMVLQQIQSGDRADWIKEEANKMLKAKTKFKESAIDKKKIEKHTVAISENPRTATGVLSSTQVLFTIGVKPFTVAEYNRYLKKLIANDDMSGDPYQRFVEQSMKEQFALTLSKMNTSYKQQLSEFKDANLLFAAMQRKVWNAANDDTSGVRAFYTKNRSKYTWEQSADALILTAATPEIAESFKQKLQKTPAMWRALVDSIPGMQADSGRYELGQVPVADRTAFSEKLITSNQPIENSTAVNFGYIIKLYPGGDIKSFEDARGQVISDYQGFLEEKWISQLKKKYPVKINDDVVRSLASD
ncbi:MAG TPA: peptidylprolyl isomerase [Flavitalea sp.]|nr:peptidylprolyl isomerase [Flavitalea sp.]